jgi:hypothetical protein
VLLLALLVPLAHLPALQALLVLQAPLVLPALLQAHPVPRVLAPVPLPPLVHLVTEKLQAARERPLLPPTLLSPTLRRRTRSLSRQLPSTLGMMMAMVTVKM